MKQKQSMGEILGGLVAYYKPYKGLFFADMFFAMLGAAISLILPLIIRHITGEVIYLPVDQATAQIVKLGILMMVLLLVEMYSNYFIGYYGHYMGAKIEHDLRDSIFSHYQKLSFSFFDDQKVGQLLSRITSDLFEITELLHHGPEDICISIIKLIGAMLILFGINAKLAVVPSVMIVIMAIYAIFMNRKMKTAFKENRKRIGVINGQIEDSLAGIRVVKSFANEKIEQEKFAEGNDAYVASKKRTYGIMGLYNSTMGMFSTFITVLSLIYGAMLMTKGMLSTADLVVYLLYINNCVEPVRKLVNFTEQFQNGYSGYERYLEIMAIDPEIKDKEDAKALARIKGDVRFDDVSFQYKDGLENVLTSVNLHVKPGDYVALVGSSGAGKTTLCSLIPRFYDVSGGAVYVDGQDIRDVKLDDLRNQIGIVQQDVYLFSGNIIENIRYGRPGATDEEVIAAAKAANAHDFIMELPNGYQTDIGQRGVKLSGGQKQRISIARVFLKNPPILIFDEATSALDNESEKVVQASLEKLAKDRTTFVIAHRLSTIRNAQRILVLTEEGIAEEGTHEELLNAHGVYAHLYQMGY